MKEIGKNSVNTESMHYTRWYLGVSFPTITWQEIRCIYVRVAKQERDKNGVECKKSDENV